MADKDSKDAGGTSEDAAAKPVPAPSSSSAAAAKVLTPQEKEVKFLKSQVAGLSILLQQNALLENEVQRLHKELDTATQSIIKRGYLYKWRDREIGWASKWGLRYFSLQGHTLSYYHEETGNQLLYMYMYMYMDYEWMDVCVG